MDASSRSFIIGPAKGGTRCNDGYAIKSSLYFWKFNKNPGVSTQIMPECCPADTQPLPENAYI
jgi:hypothetical protein